MTAYPAKLVTFSSDAVTGTLGGDATPAIAAAGNYTAGDVVSNSASNGVGVAWVFPDMALDVGGTGEIVGAILTFSAALVTATYRLWLFDAIPAASELDDNAAFSLHANDQAKLVGVVDFAACVALGGVAGSVTAALSKPFRCAAADTDLYGILQDTAGETNEAPGMICVIKLLVRRG